MARKFAASLSEAQVRWARRVEAAGLASYSQAVKTIERDDRLQIGRWKAALDQQDAARVNS
jgi:hypothetical protein